MPSKFLSVAFFLLTLFTFNTPSNASQNRIDPRLARLKENLKALVLDRQVNENEVDKFSKSLKEDGSWGNISYSDTSRGGWKVIQHLENVRTMAVAYMKPGSRFSGNQELKSKILLAYNFWVKNDFICPNWWYPQIGVPKELAPTMILIEDHLSDAETKAGLKVLNRSKMGMTGQNKVWLAGNVIFRSIITNDFPLVQKAAESIKEEIVVSEKEGIQPDFSFHQHGPQQQFGNYGLGYTADITRWGLLFRGTPFEYNKQQADVISSYLLDGMRWIVWKGQMDISACGRQLFMDTQKSKAGSLASSLEVMPIIKPELKNQFSSALNDFEGNKHFWRSDMSVHRRNNFYTSVKMSSNRVSSSESCNGENLRGYHLGDGATYFYQNEKEYLNIFPFWDWKRIPGTTTFHNEAAPPLLGCSGHYMKSDFVGGVSDGRNGIATMAYERDGLKAKKSWFFFDDAIICVGADISASGKTEKVNTTINQSFLNGKVVIKKSGVAGLLKKGTHKIDNVSWLIHDKWGYYFPNSSSVNLINSTQSGDWSKVAVRYPKKEEKADLFTLWIDHDSNPKGDKYAYYVFPAASEADIEKRASAIKLRKNADEVQFAEVEKKGLLGVVFITPTLIETELVKKLSADKACVMMIEKANRTLNVTISDPSHLESKITLGIQGEIKSQTHSARYDKGKNMTFITIDLPKGPEAGKSLRFALNQ